ncbi:hypothetical protein GCM10023185_43830 [Hymenobacter saemangeumensis]|uniref:HEAT repeat domain-containing protein n=1 Tax=Hymenobacter saemangeumensis TaxID=1084522 RepID=A0ABP8IS44_9BACT
MNALKKLFPYALTSAAVIGLWHLFTLTDNDLSTSTDNKLVLLNQALSTIFFYKTLFWLVLANLGVFISKSILNKQNQAAVATACVGLAFYFYIGQFVDKNCAFPYYRVFVSQSVAEEYLQRPIEEAGYYIGPILTEKIEDRQMEFRRYAISGLGDINYKPATKMLGQILVDKTEVEWIRADAYVALTKFNTASARKILRDFQVSSSDTTDQKVVALGNYFLLPN